MKTDALTPGLKPRPPKNGAMHLRATTLGQRGGFAAVQILERGDVGGVSGHGADI